MSVDLEDWDGLQPPQVEPAIVICKPAELPIVLEILQATAPKE